MNLFNPTKKQRIRAARHWLSYGKKSEAIFLAQAILRHGPVLVKPSLKTPTTRQERKLFREYERMYSLMLQLLMAAFFQPEYLRDVADALIQLQNGGIKTADDRAVTLELVTAFEDCIGCHPPPAELKRAFIARTGSEDRWPGNKQAKRNLRRVWLEPGKDKPGRPRGARSVQKMYGGGKQPRRKLVQKKP